MIAASTGEVSFVNGLCIRPHSLIGTMLDTGKDSVCIRVRKLPVQGWNQLLVGIHKSDFGDFEVEVVTGLERRIEAVFLSHNHAFYNATEPEDAERRIFHHGVIASDLRGQREFDWGNVFCRVDKESNRDWLVLIYNPFASVPLHARNVYKQLFAEEVPPAD